MNNSKSKLWGAWLIPALGELPKIAHSQAAHNAAWGGQDVRVEEDFVPPSWLHFMPLMDSESPSHLWKSPQAERGWCWMTLTPISRHVSWFLFPFYPLWDFPGARRTWEELLGGKDQMPSRERKLWEAILCGNGWAPEASSEAESSNRSRDLWIKKQGDLCTPVTSPVVWLTSLACPGLFRS